MEKSNPRGCVMKSRIMYIEHKPSPKRRIVRKPGKYAIR